MNDSSRTFSGRSPVPAILGSIIGGAALATLLVLTIGAGGSEPVVTGSALLGFGIGWGLIARTTSRFSAQPQAWAAVPAALLGVVGVGLIAFQPRPAVMDLLGWVWPPSSRRWRSGWSSRSAANSTAGAAGSRPVIATLLVFAVGGGLATVSTTTAGRPARARPADRRRRAPAVHRVHGLGRPGGHPPGRPRVHRHPPGRRIAPAVAAQRPRLRLRPGRPRTERRGRGPQDGIALATDLHTLLERAGVPGPYLLVGHSSGGPYVRVFAARYPAEVAGMVLLDPQPADAFTALPGYSGPMRPQARRRAVPDPRPDRAPRTDPRTAGRRVDRSGRPRRRTRSLPSRPRWTRPRR